MKFQTKNYWESFQLSKQKILKFGKLTVSVETGLTRLCVQASDTNDTQSCLEMSGNKLETSLTVIELISTYSSYSMDRLAAPNTYDEYMCAPHCWAKLQVRHFDCSLERSALGPTVKDGTYL